MPASTKFFVTYKGRIVRVSGDRAREMESGRAEGAAGSYLDRGATAPQHEDLGGPHALLCLHAPYAKLSVVNRGFFGRECRHVAVWIEREKLGQKL